MMKKYFAFIALFCMLIWHAQNVTVTPSPANCPGQGSVIVTTAPAVLSPNFQFYNSTGGVHGAPNTTGKLTALDAGNYSVTVTGSGGFIETKPFTIVDGYTPIPTPTVNINGLCDNTFTLGGTLNVTMPNIPGKSYEYKVVKDPNVGFPESAAPYIPLTTITNITSFGVYQIRIKDECGAVVTVTRNIQPTLAAITSFYMETWNNQACNSGTFQIKNLGFITANGTRVSVSEYTALGGIKIEMWENTGAGCPTSAPVATPIFSKTFTSNDPTGPTDLNFVLQAVASGRYIIRMTTPCGESHITCEDLNYTNTPRMDVAATNSGCDPNEKMTIAGKDNGFLNFPVDVEVKNSAGVVVHTETNLASYQNRLTKN